MFQINLNVELDYTAKDNTPNQGSTTSTRHPNLKSLR